MKGINTNAILREMSHQPKTTVSAPKVAAKKQNGNPLHCHVPADGIPKNAKNVASSSDRSYRTRSENFKGLSANYQTHLAQKMLSEEISEIFGRVGIDESDFEGMSITSSPTRFFGPQMGRA